MRKIAYFLFSIVVSLFFCAPNSYSGKVYADESVAVTAHEKPVSGWYIRTHGKEWDQIIAPYTLDYAQQNNIDTSHLLRTLFTTAATADENQYSISISSYRYSGGDWTFIKSNSIQLYELAGAMVEADSTPLLFALYNDSLPYAVIKDKFSIQWNAALLDNSCNILSKVTFTDELNNHEEGVYDMIYTFAGIDSNLFIVKTMYAHVGGNGWNQEFTTRFSILKNPIRLHHISTEQTIDERGFD